MNTETLLRLAKRVDANVPHHAMPEKFHEEKSEIVDELKRLAKSDEVRNSEGRT